jgi:hypothetical protein
MKKKIIDLEIIDDLEEAGASKISLVDQPAINLDWVAFAREEFIYPEAGEDKDTFIGKCIAYNIDEGKPEDQAAAICYRVWEEHNLSVDVSALPAYVDETGDNKKKKFEEENIIVFGYPTRFFYICPGAIGTFTALQEEELDNDTIGMVRAAAIIADRVFEIEKTVLDEGVSSMEQLKEAAVLVKDFYDIFLEIAERTKTFPDVSYMDEHLLTIASYIPEDKEEFAAVEDLKVGDAVSWKTADQNPRGRIREIVRNGGKTVPGTSFILQGTQEDPGYIIEIFEKKDGKWAPTGKYAGRKADSILKNVELWRQKFALEEDEQILVGPAMIPDMDIPRKDKKTKEVYSVRFSKDVIARIAEKFMRELRNRDTNIQHEDNEAGAYVMETWLVESESDKLNTVYGFNVPVGTWAIKMRVEDPETWQMVKDGKLNGFSIEGSFLDKEDYDKYVRDKQIYEKVMKILKSK